MTRRLSLLALLALSALGAAGTVIAHEVRPAYLEVRELDAGRYDLLWKVPARGDRRLALYVRLPDTCRGTPPATRFVGGAYIERWRAECDGGLGGREIAIEGLSSTRTDVLARLQRRDGGSQTVRLTPENVVFTVTASPSAWNVVRTYTSLGVEHILLGIDHLLFVLGLMLIVRGVWALVKTITAFTVAHSLTLAAATLGWIGVPVAPVEAAIALSIVFVAVEAIKIQRGEGGLTVRYPWVVAFAFGLLHGLGFASALSQVGIPEPEIPLALLFFNIGVEIGQLVFVLLVLALGWALRHAAVHMSRWGEAVAVYAIGTVASFWFVERTVQMLGA